MYISRVKNQTKVIRSEGRWHMWYVRVVSVERHRNEVEKGDEP